MKLRKLQSEVGMHRDGEVPGLYLRVSDKAIKGKTVNGCSWVLRIVVNGKRRDLGLGGYPATTLAEARALAREYRGMVKRGIDPLERVRKQKAEAAKASERAALTFETVARERFEVREPELSAKEAKDWMACMVNYAFPEIGNIPIADVTVDDVLKVLKPIWKTKTSSAGKLRLRMEDVFRSAVARKLRSDNPAVWRDLLKYHLAKPSKIHKTRRQPSLPYDQIQRFMQDLKTRKGIAPLALEFSILTAARSQAVTGATWDEIDLKAGVWTLPAERAGVKHPEGEDDIEIALSPRAIEILKSLPTRKGRLWVRRGIPIRPDSLNQLLKQMHERNIKAGGKGYMDPKEKRRAVQHGFRATFRTWAAEQTAYPDFLAELCLGHKQPNAVVRAYKRTTLLEKRSALMADWAKFIYQEPGARGKNVVGIRA